MPLRSCGPGASALLRRVGFPHPPYARLLLLSGFFIWLVLRSFLAVGLALTHGAALQPPHWKAGAVLLALPVLLTLLDVRVVREGVFCRDAGARPACLRHRR